MIKKYIHKSGTKVEAIQFNRDTVDTLRKFIGDGTLTRLTIPLSTYSNASCDIQLPGMEEAKRIMENQWVVKSYVEGHENFYLERNETFKKGYTVAPEVLSKACHGLCVIPSLFIATLNTQKGHYVLTPHLSALGKVDVCAYIYNSEDGALKFSTLDIYKATGMSGFEVGQYIMEMSAKQIDYTPTHVIAFYKRLLETPTGSLSSILLKDSLDSFKRELSGSSGVKEERKTSQPYNRIILASNNEAKVQEIKEMLKQINLSLPVQTLKEAGFKISVIEDAPDFAGNAKLKAEAVVELAPDAIILADDSGLCINALNGAPGVHSARYLGKDTSYEDRMNHILESMKDLPMTERKARLITAMAIARKGHPTETVEGRMDGFISIVPKGKNGFAYDPIFFVTEHMSTLAELTPEQKNALSHRDKALKAALEKINKIMQK